MCKWLAAMAGAFFGLLATGPTFADDFPTRPITMIVPFPAGEATDALARVLGKQMRAILGQPVIIEDMRCGSICRPTGNPSS
jgi:tripartite-type tricarboxylate transporter receptor subunit TctC